MEYRLAHCISNAEALGCPNRNNIANANLSGDDILTNGPHNPPFRISWEPLGQSVAITGVPMAMALIRTVGKPSKSDESTNKSDRAT